MENQDLEKYIQLSCGNPGAITVIIEIYKNHPLHFVKVMDELEKRQIIDYHIWDLYKEKGKDIIQFIKHLLS